MKYFDDKRSPREIIVAIIRSPSLRLDISLIFGILMNIVYIITNFLSSVMYRSIWSATLTVYYSLFVGLRLYLVSSRSRETEEGDARREAHKVCLKVGVILLLLDFAASVVMLRTARGERFTPYSGLALLGFLSHTLYSILASVAGMRRSSRADKPITFAARNMTLAATLISLFNLQYSVLTTLGASVGTIKLANTLTSALVFFTIILLSLRLIIKNVIFLYKTDT